MKNWQKIKQNPQLLDTFLVREKVIDAIRDFFKTQDFHEVETPLLVKHPGTEPFLEVFKTTLKTASPNTDATSPQFSSQPAFLLTSPEFAMKKLIAAGMGNLFQICKSFRNGEGLSSRHNPEFTILEWYRVNADYRDIMTDFERLMLHIMGFVKSGEKQIEQKLNWQSINETAKTPSKKYRLIYQYKNFNISPPYPRMSVFEAFQKYLGIKNKEELLSREALKEIAQEKDYQVSDESTWEEIYNQLFLNEIEPKLAQFNTPVIIYDYPASQAALARRKKDDPRFAERFEVYLAGLELGNAFSELTDAEEQEKRFREELALRKKLGKTEYSLDKDYIDALKSGLPETGGIAVGVDRLVMLFADASSIEEITFFPGQEVFSSS
jgi:lysyl-tRNA synthetase class 2